MNVVNKWNGCLRMMNGFVLTVITQCKMENAMTNLIQEIIEDKNVSIKFREVLKGDNVSGHTKGKWIINKAKKPDNTGGFDYAISDEFGNILAETFENVGEENGFLVKSPAEANARLIAAAPELLEACKKMVEIAPKLWGEDPGDHPKVMDRIEQAISNAEANQ